MIYRLYKILIVVTLLLTLVSCGIPDLPGPIGIPGL